MCPRLELDRGEEADEEEEVDIFEEDVLEVCKAGDRVDSCLE